MKHYDATMPKYNDFFTSCCLMTNFIHRWWMDYSKEIIGGRNNDVGVQQDNFKILWLSL